MKLLEGRGGGKYMKSKITILSTNTLNSRSFVHIAASLSGGCAVKDINAPVSIYIWFVVFFQKIVTSLSRFSMVSKSDVNIFWKEIMWFEV